MIKSLSPESNSFKPAADQSSKESSKKPLSLAISFFAPVCSEPGSASLFLFQPLLTVKVFAAVSILIAAQIFIVLAERFFGLKLRAVQTGPFILPGQAVETSLSDFQNLLIPLSNGNTASSTNTSATATGQTIPGTISGSTPNIPLVLSLTVYGSFCTGPYTPSVFLQFPLITFHNLRGALPILILELLTTIFVRSVVTPETAGAKPLPTQPNLN